MKNLYLPLLVLAFLLAACGGDPAPVTPTENNDAQAASETTDADHGHEEEDEDHEHDQAEDNHSATDGLNIDHFFDGALAETPEIVDCTLSDGTATSCYSITVVGYPVNHDVGPFCPTTTAATADDVGIWLDGEAIYDVDGAFILSLAEIYGDDNWQLYDDDGNVNVTESVEAFEAAARPDVDPAYQNHCVEGRMEWLPDGNPVPTTALIPVAPVSADNAQSAGNLGITLNGVVIANAAPVDAILSAYTIAAFDDCGGHINPIDGYHLHGARGCSEVGDAAEGETPIFAYAMDGYAIHSPLPTDEALDDCGGHTTDALGYHYHASPAAENAVLPCLTGFTVSTGNAEGRGGDGNRPEGDNAGGRGGRPDFAAAAEALGVTEDALVDALGGPPPNFEAAAETLGVSIEDLQAAMGGGPGGGRQQGGGGGG